MNIVTLIQPESVPLTDNAIVPLTFQARPTPALQATREEFVMAALEIRLLGPCLVTLDGRPLLPLRTVKAQALLCYLLAEHAVAPGVRPRRETLMELLWPGMPPASARQSLRQNLYLLRRALPEIKGHGDEPVPLLLSDRHSVAIHPDARFALDLAAFLALIEEKTVAALAEAVRLYRGDFLEDLYLEDSAEFEAWAGAHRARLQRQALEALESLANHALARGDAARAAQFARRQLELDDLREGAHRQLMEALARSGERSAALVHYDQLRGLLQEELDVAPSEATEALVAAIASGASPASIALSVGRSEAGERSGAALPTSNGPPSRAHNLPLQLTSFVGREQELATLTQHLQPAVSNGRASRLVTLTGPGGVGKTRLALEGAAQIVAYYPAGVWLVELAGLSEPELVPAAVASVLGVQEKPQTPVLQALCDFLQARPWLLLLLDNCEHLVDACANLANSLLAVCPELRILTTSREPLGIRGEAILPLSGLGVVADSHHPLNQSQAVHLFLQRAHLVRPNFALTPENSGAVQQICRRLDGMPLAIELAAAHLRLLSVAALAERLQDHFPLLQTRERVVDRRHQSMRAVVDWSYRLLDEAERRLFARLSVFRGGFTLEAAEALAPEANVLELLASLIDKSMVIAESTAESGIRYHLLETLRLYGQQRLEEIGELDVMQAAHAAYYCAMAEQAEPALHGAAQKVWSQRLQQEHDNLRAALQWALASPEPDQIQTGVGLRLAAALWWFWCLHIYISEGRKWLTLALDNSAGNAELEAPLARLTSRAGFLVGYLGDYKTAGRLANQAVALARRVDDHDSLGLAICVQGFRAWATGDQTGAIALFDEALTVLRAHGSRHLLGLVLVTTATIVLSLLSQNAYMAALVEEALPILEAVGDRYSMPRALCLKGTAALRKGNFKEGIENLERALHLAREMKIKADIGLSAFLLSQAWLPRGRLDLAEVLSEEGVSALDESGIPDLLASALRVQGMIAHRKGDLSHAEAYLTRSEQLLRQGGIGQGLAIVLREIGAVLLEQGRTADAERYFRESLDYAGNWAPELDQAHALYGLAAVAAQDGRPLRGARLAAFVDAMYEADPPPPLVEAGLAVLRPLLAGLSEALSEADLEAARREGRRMSMEEAIAYARDDAIRTL